MDEHTQNGKVQDSIRPVSALRSLFEKNPTGTLKSTGLTRSPTKAPVEHSLEREGIWTNEHVSLEIHGGASSNATLKSLPQTREGKSVSASHRDVEHALSSPFLEGSQSPPLVSAHSPKSSPHQSVVLSQASSPFTHTGSQVRPPQVAPPPPTRASSSTPSNLTSVVRKEEYKLPISDQAGSVDGANLSTGRLDRTPPPTNRAEKPKVPVKPSQIAWKARLQASARPVEEKISPFSTPPSSDDNMDAQNTTNDDFSRSKQMLRKASFDSHSMKESPRLSKPSQQELQTLNPESLTTTQGTDSRQFGFNLALGKNNPRVEHRPDLPPRRSQAQASSGTQSCSHRENTIAEEKNRPPRQRTAAYSQFGSGPLTFKPPPKRALILKTSAKPSSAIADTSQNSKTQTGSSFSVSDKIAVPVEQDAQGQNPSPSDYPDTSRINRRPPKLSSGAQELLTGYETRVFDVCGPHVVSTGHFTKVWDLHSGEQVAVSTPTEKEQRVISMAFKSEIKACDEGSHLWLGTNDGELQEVGTLSQTIIKKRIGVHERREIIRIFRHQSSMWTLDDGGKLCTWFPNEGGLPDLHYDPMSCRVPRGHTTSIVVQDMLWMATGKEIWIFRPLAAGTKAFSVIEQPLVQISSGVTTSAAVISGRLDCVYFGHADGKISVYSTQNFECLASITVSIYKITALAGAGFYLWAGFGTGIIAVYDTRTKPWTVKKEWLAHTLPLVNIVMDPGGLWRDDSLRVVSLGVDNALRIWDGTLEMDWLESDILDRDIEYCTFREATALVITWNAGAATPTHLRHEAHGQSFFHALLSASEPADVLVFGFQELVDLEDKKLTAKSLFKGSKKKDPQEQEHMSHQYRAWRDYLVQCVEEAMPPNAPYHLMHTANMVGLFSCIFIKGSQRDRVHDVSAAEIKRGMGGLHGNKGALVFRFVLDDTSLCFANCHLAAGQTQTNNRNSDLTAILESNVLLPNQSSSIGDAFIGGGDGSMILDHEICILNGDLNYRIDTMGRDTVIKAVKAKNFAKLLERDQLLVSRRRNPLLKIRAFKELPITFAPTYKYDLGSDTYDTSEKRRAPAWCDRILYRGTDKVKALQYNRHELRMSDHRPVSGLFKMRIKSADMGRRARVWEDTQRRFQQAKKRLASDARIGYLRDVLGVPPDEARQLI